MTDELHTLQDLAQLASDRNDGKKGRALGRIAEKHGLTLSYTTFDNILAGRYHSTPTRKTVDSIAYLAGVDPMHAYELAGLPLPQSPLADQLPPDVDTLPPEQRRVLIEMARVLVKQNRELYDLKRKAGDGDGKATPHTDAGGTPVTGADDGIGAFGGRARGDLDHESVNDGSGDNIRNLGERRQLSAERLAELDELQRRADAATDDEIDGKAAYDPDGEDGEN